MKISSPTNLIYIIYDSSVQEKGLWTARDSDSKNILCYNTSEVKGAIFLAIFITFLVVLKQWNRDMV